MAEAPRPLTPGLHNFPISRVPFIGRERELEAVCALLRRPDVALLTLTGPGGAGKTRLAGQVATALPADFADGAFFVPLAPLNDPARVLTTIAAVLRVREAGGQTLLTSLVEALQDRHLLLVLDNFEHVAGAAAEVGALLAACRGLKVLATSREVLRLYGEHSYLVPPLALPESQALPPLERLAQYEAVRLFSERAQAAKPEFVLTEAHAPAVVAICRRLDGLPLAIELAAAWVRLLAPPELLTRLDHRLRLLMGGPRDFPARHQTLRATLDWSHDLLTPAEQILFRRLAVFAGGCALAAAERVASGEWRVASGEPSAISHQESENISQSAIRNPQFSVLDGIASLVDKSLLRSEELGGEARVAMLETIREYAWEQLAAHGETTAAQHRHAACYLALAEEAEQVLLGPQAAAWLDRMEREHDNLRAALRWTLDAGAGEMALRLCAALRVFWNRQGYFHEQQQWLDAALALTPDVGTAVRAKVLNAAGVLAMHQGQLTRAHQFLEENVVACRALADPAALAAALNNLGQLALFCGDYAQARLLLEENVVLRRAQADPVQVGRALINLGEVVSFLGEEHQAQALLEEGIAVLRAAGDQSGVGSALYILGQSALRQADYGRAAGLLEASLAAFQATHGKRNIAHALEQLGVALLRQGDYARAAASLLESLALLQTLNSRLDLADCLVSVAELAVTGGPHPAGTLLGAQLCGAVAALRAATGLTQEFYRQTEYDRVITVIRARLDEATFAATYAAGQALPLDEVPAGALREIPLLLQQAALAPALTGAGAPASAPAPPPAAGLTSREIEVLRLVAQGLTNEQIAAELVLSPRTVQTHLRNVYDKLGGANRAGATRYALEHHLV